MAFTTEQLEALELAISKGTRRVRYADKEVEYRTLDEMLRLRDLMRVELGLVPKTVRLFTHHNKGL